jgi:6,7-dimethyl-8-ribityllumazine synthase
MARPQRAKTSTQMLQNARILVIEARFYDDITDALVEGALRVLRAAGATWDRVTVPGSLEIPAAIAIALDAAERKRRPYDGVVALGCVIRGETFHFEIVAMQSARALVDISVARRIPVGNGIVTVDSRAQAMARARPDKGDKGGDAARAALVLAEIKRRRLKR